MAQEVRRLLGAPAPRTRPRQKGAARPAAVVETTGRPETVVLATKRVCDMGTVVMAGPVPGGRLDLNV